MKKQYAYSPGMLRFRRWSRKGYAAFSSLRRIVTIGSLGCRVVESLQRKNGLSLGFVTIFLSDEDKTFSEDMADVDLFSGQKAWSLDGSSCSETDGIPCIGSSELYYRGRKVPVLSGVFRFFYDFGPKAGS